MKQYDPFSSLGNWYKGNLHCHSNKSDGKLSPEEVAKIYKNNGWNFLAFTEHGLLTHNSYLDSENFLIIPGIESTAAKLYTTKRYHMVGIVGESYKLDGTSIKSNNLFIRIFEKFVHIQRHLNNWHGSDRLSVLCHPMWSKLKCKDIDKLKKLQAIEIFNYGCEIENNTGLCTDYWDKLLKRGKRIWGIASDDAHHRLKDQCGGWVMVKADNLSYRSIIKSLKRGRFYSSNGPTIEKYCLKDREVVVECSKVDKIIFYTGRGTFESSKLSTQKGTSTSIYSVNYDDRYVRVECIDSSGKVAWTNPIFLTK